MVIPSSAIIDYSKLFSQSHANIYNLINTRSNIADPTGKDRKFIYTREPEDMATEFDDYPIIIVENVDLNQANSSVDGNHCFVEYFLAIRVWTSDRTKTIQGNPSGSEQMNTISNDIIKTLNANRVILRSYGMKNFSVRNTETDWEEQNGAMIFRREFNLQFKQRIKVIA
jgi:hypothetical protein